MPVELKYNAYTAEEKVSEVSKQLQAIIDTDEKRKEFENICEEITDDVTLYFNNCLDSAVDEIVGRFDFKWEFPQDLNVKTRTRIANLILDKKLFRKTFLIIQQIVFEGFVQKLESKYFSVKNIVLTREQTGFHKNPASFECSVYYTKIFGE